MDHTIDPEYQFRFEGPDGRTYCRQVYYEALYVFYMREGLVLAADRVVPHSGMHYALYQMLQDNSAKSVIGTMLPEAAGRPALPAHGSAPTDLAEKVEEVLPDTVSDLPADYIREAVDRAEAVISGAMAPYGIDNGLMQFDGMLDLADVEIRGRRAAGTLNLAAGVEDEDAAWVNLSFDVDRNLKKWIRRNLKEQKGTGDSLARQGDLEEDIYRRLYADRRYLNFVRQVMNARGGYASPVVRDFLAFYARCLNKKLTTYAEEESVAPDIVRKRLEGLFGTVKGRSHHFLNYHDLNILGRVPGERLPKDEADPDQTETSHKVDPDLKPESLLITEVEGIWQRFVVKKYVQHTFNIHHNIQRVHYVDEEEDPTESP